MICPCSYCSVQLLSIQSTKVENCWSMFGHDSVRVIIRFPASIHLSIFDAVFCVHYFPRRAHVPKHAKFPYLHQSEISLGWVPMQCTWTSGLWHLCKWPSVINTDLLLPLIKQLILAYVRDWICAWNILIWRHIISSKMSLFILSTLILQWTMKL